MVSLYDGNTTAGSLVFHLQNEITGKTILVTGASPGGLGAIFAEHVAKAKPRLLMLAGRTTSKLQATADTITQVNSSVEVRLLPLDLESFARVREAAATVKEWTDVPHIDVLVNDAGIMACDYAATEDGIERQFAVGHLGPFLFTNLIMGKLLAAPWPRVVMVSSNDPLARHWPSVSDTLFITYNHIKNDADTVQEGTLYNKWRAYGQAKTANILMAVAVAKRLGEKDLTAVSLHPGAIKTNLSTHLDWKVEFGDLRGPFLCISKTYHMLTMVTYLEAVDQELGNVEGFAKGFDYKSPERGVATHIFAALAPSLRGKLGN